MAKITNINGKSDTTCKCGTWLLHWKNFCLQSIPTYCTVIGCYEKNLVGSHVQNANSIDKNWYILPLCKTHNTSTKDLEISDYTKLALADKKLTCEKQSIPFIKSVL